MSGSEACGWAGKYGRALLRSLDEREPRTVHLEAMTDHPAIAWARCGAMWLTGPEHGAPQLVPAPLASCAEGAIAALRALSGGRLPAALSGASLLGERAAVAGLQRRGRISPGGGCRLLDTADGALALSLTRDDDWALLDAWLEDAGAWDWERVEHTVRRGSAAGLLERARLLGLAAAPLAAALTTPPAWFRVAHSSAPAPPRTHGAPQLIEGAQNATPLVVDLSSLWAGPLCAHLLALCGARVVKVESRQRPDGARAGPQAFFDLLNAGKQSLVLDFDSAADRAQLRELCLDADIVIEASRPRALRQLGIEAERLIERNARLTWVSITGYGRDEPEAGWIAYGDDAAVAAGLASLLQEVTGEALICGDAIADPLTGVHAALAAWHGYLSGGGRLLSIALRDVAAHCGAFDLPPDRQARRRRHREWLGVLETQSIAVQPPQARTSAGRAPVLAEPGRRPSTAAVGT